MADLAWYRIADGSVAHTDTTTYRISPTSGGLLLETDREVLAGAGLDEADDLKRAAQEHHDAPPSVGWLAALREGIEAHKRPY